MKKVFISWRAAVIAILIKSTVNLSSASSYSKLFPGNENFSKNFNFPIQHLRIYVLAPFQAPGYGDVRLSLETIPDTVNLEEPFDITCKITNCR